jgi:hypothetical protein
VSRGHGSRQRAILDRLAGNKAVPLGGKNRSEASALLRAARALERAGKLVIVRLWNDNHTAVVPCVALPDATIDGKPVKELSVARVPYGAAAALTGSLRAIAAAEGVSKTQIARDLAEATRRGK